VAWVCWLTIAKQVWLPTGGHVEPGEHPAATVRHESGGTEYRGCVLASHRRENPDVCTVAGTARAAGRHMDVALWFVLTCRTSQSLAPDPHEFRAVCCWTTVRIRRADPALFLICTACWLSSTTPTPPAIQTGPAKAQADPRLRTHRHTTDRPLVGRRPRMYLPSTSRRSPGQLRIAGKPVIRFCRCERTCSIGRE
jgi:hypothetical protein